MGKLQITKTKIYNVLVPTLTFFLGIIFQLLFTEWIASKDIIPFAILLIVVSLAFIFTASLSILYSIEKRFNVVDMTLTDIVARTGLKVEFIRDRAEGYTYQRSIKLIESAQKSLTFVGPWEPYGKYQADPARTKLRSEREEYYKTIIRQIERHKYDETVFHRRIIQVPKGYENKQLPFEVDKTFHAYLKYTAEIQNNHHNSCHLRKVNALINTHFTVIDDKYVIMPIFGYYKDEEMLRYGVLFFQDDRGDLVDCLNSIYRTLDSQSHYIAPSEIKTPSDG